MVLTAGLDIRLDQHPDHAVVHLAGDLGLRTVTRCRDALGDALAKHGKIVVDLSEMRQVEPICLIAFPALLAARGGWPWAKLALACTPPHLNSWLARSRIPDIVPCYPSTPEALQGIDRRPNIVSHAATLPDNEISPALARALVATCCAVWAVPVAVRPVAAIVVSELVTNAVLHARPPLSVRAARTAAALTIQARDGSRTAPVAPATGTPVLGRGLSVVRALAHHWGVTPRLDGKTVWARLRLVPERPRG